MAGRDDLQQMSERIEALVADIERFADPQARAVGEELVRVLLEFYGAGLARVLEIAGDQPGGEALVERLAADDIVGSLLVLHDLHPVDLETRVRTALAEAATSVGLATVDLTAIEDEVVRVAFSASGCASSTQAIVQALEDAVLAVAPEIAAVEAEAAPAAPALLHIQPLRPKQAAAVPGSAG
jgi:CRP-like cAMP-binding protein